jgi:lipopolysaccharide biosynthesis regulator YciM
MSHIENLATMRAQIARKNYSDALRLGRSEIARGCDSSELLVLMATAALLGEGEECSLEEVREWLERAVECDPRNVDAHLELGHFLDTVVDESSVAIPVFETALEKTINLLETALDGLNSTAGLQDTKTQERVRALLARASRLLSSTSIEE